MLTSIGPIEFWAIEFRTLQALRPGSMGRTRENGAGHCPGQDISKVEVALDRRPMTPWREPRQLRIAAHHRPAQGTIRGPCRFIPRIDPNSSEFAGNAEVMRGLVAELRDKLEPGRRRRRQGLARATYLARKNAGARPRRPADRSRHRVSGIVAARRPRPLWRRRAFGERHHRRRAHLGPRMHHRRQ